MTAGLPRVVVLGSGAGSNFEALADAADEHYEIVAVGSDKPTAPILERACRRGITVFAASPSDHPDRAAHDAALAGAMRRHKPDWVALAGYMRILGPETLAVAPDHTLNVHPALLPAFPGLHTHRRALEAGVREHGSTVHFVTVELDAGPAIMQAELIVQSDDTAATLETRIKAMEHRIYPRALAECAAGRITLHNGTTWRDGQPLDQPLIVNET